MLLLYSEPRLLPAILSVDRGIRETLESRSPVPVTFYTEYLDLNLFDGDAPQAELQTLLHRKYASRPLDLIVAAGSRSLRIALRNRAEVFSGAPVVFVAVDSTAAADLKLGEDVTGTWLRQGWAETLDLARRLQPGTRQAVVVTGSSPAERSWLDEARQQLTAASGAVKIRYLADRPLEEILAEVAALPPQSVVLAGPFVRDAAGRDFVTSDAIALVAQAAKVATYGLTEASIGAGVVGGHVASFEAHASVAGELALRVLAGERPPPTDAGTIVPMVDARQLDRWKLDARRLPAGTVVRFREPSLWEQHRWTVATAAGALLLQGALIAGLLVQRTMRRRAQESLAKRLRFESLLADLSSRFASSSDADTERSIQEGLELVGEGLRVDFATIRVLDQKSGEARLTQVWTRPGVPPRPAVIREDQTPWIFARVRQGQSLHLADPRELPDEAGIDRKSLAALQIGSTVVLPLIAKHEVIGFFSVGTVHPGPTWVGELVSRLRLVADDFANALERRRAEAAARESETQIRDLAGRLMTAQEEERRRIARDLHDGVNQELAALSIALSRVGDRLPVGTTPDVGDELARLQGRTVALSESVRQLSHELHPGMLQHIGLVGALRGYCRGFEREHDLRVHFRADGDLGGVSANLGLCLYRVVQEGLGNVAKHAGAREVRVTVSRLEGDVQLTVTDDGSGFDPLEARTRRGLGLLSLDERVRLLGGRLTVDAKPRRGTELRIRIPVPEDGDASDHGSAG